MTTRQKQRKEGDNAQLDIYCEGDTCDISSQLEAQESTQQAPNQSTVSEGRWSSKNYNLLSSDTRGLAQAYDMTIDEEDFCIIPKPIFVLSDCTGESASFTVRSALNQFEGYVNTSCPANLVIFRFLDNPQYLERIMKRAKDEDALIVYTLVDPTMGQTIRTLSYELEIKIVDLWGNLLDVMENHLESQRIGVPFGSQPRQKKNRLRQDYFKFIEAVEYTRKMDDGANPSKWKNCDIMLLGLSRCGKTPLSIYLGQRGYKVANLPLCQGVKISEHINDVDPSKVFCLNVDIQVLASIRGVRQQEMGVEGHNFKYNNVKAIREEVEWANDIYKQHSGWTVLDVTFRSVEESATQIQRLITQRFNNYGDGMQMY